MYTLSRRVRINMSPAELLGRAAPAGGPQRLGVGLFFELEVTCRGEADRATGYLMNISVIDDAVRRCALAPVRRALVDWAGGSERSVGAVLADVLEGLRGVLGDGVAAVTWHVSPYHWVRFETASMTRVQFSHRFEFAAAHRLHCPEMSEEGNRAVFGKCNNPGGHGHNYRLETAVSVPLEGGRPFTLDDLRRIVGEQVLDRLDHRNLNLDVPEFAELNPSVEHIARVCHELLAGPIETAGGRLDRVTIWETDKTCCTYPAPEC